MNVGLLRRIQRHIRKEPKRLEMTVWIRPWPSQQGGPACGTAACIAGWAMILSGILKGRREPRRAWEPDGRFRQQASRLLGLSAEQARSLFLLSAWPRDLSRRFVRASSEDDQSRAAIACERIDRFIAEEA